MIFVMSLCVVISPEVKSFTLLATSCSESACSPSALAENGCRQDIAPGQDVHRVHLMP